MQYNPKYEEHANILNACSVIFFVRYKQFGRVLKKIEMIYHFSPRISQILRLINLFLTNIYIIHVLACVWIIIANVQYDKSQTWLHINDILNENWYIQYLNAFYFNTVTMVTVGYGDVSPQTNFERIFSIITVFSACGVFAYSISEVGSIFQEMNKSSKQRKNNLFVINNYMKKKKITSELQYQIRHYLEYYWNESLSENSQKEANIIGQLSNNLKENLMIEANKILVAESPFFRDNFSFKTILKTVSLVQEQRCTPEEIIYLEGDLEECSIYFIEKGSVQIFRDHTSESILFKKEFMECNTLRAGQYFGDLPFFTGMQRRFCVRSLEFTTLIKIERAKFIEIIKEIPSDYEKFCQIKDDIIFNNNYKHYMKKCTYCQHIESGNRQHTSRECPIVHYIPNNLRLLDQFKYFNSLTQTERSLIKRYVLKHFNTLGRIEQVKGYQDRLAFQEHSTIFAQIQTYGIEDFSKNQESSDSSISKSETISSSNSIQEQNDDSCLKSKLNLNNQIKNQYSDSFESSNESNSIQSLSAERVSQSSSKKQNHIFVNNQKTSNQAPKSLVISEDQLELETNQFQVSTNTLTNQKTQNKINEFDSNIGIEEYPKYLKQIQIQENIFNHSIIIHKNTPFGRQSINQCPINQVIQSENSKKSQIKNQIYSQGSQHDVNEQSECNIDFQKNRNQNITQNQFSSNQLIQTESNQEPQISKISILSPQRQKQKYGSSILQSVKFKLPNKKLYMKNKSLQDIRLFKDSQKKGVQNIDKNYFQQINLIDNQNYKMPFQISQKQNYNSSQNLSRHQQENYKLLSSQQQKNTHKLKRFSSSGHVIQNSQLFLNTTNEKQDYSSRKQKQLKLNNLLQQRLSTQLENITSNFQKIQDFLVNQTHTHHLNYQAKLSFQQNLNNNQTMKEFDKMKIFEIYFPRNNYDQIIFQLNQFQFNKSSRNKYSLAFSPSKRLQQNKYVAQQNNFTGQGQIIKEIINQNTLNRLKYLKNENNKNNSFTDKLFISQLSLRKRCNTNLSLPIEKTDLISPSSNQDFYTQTNQDEEVIRGYSKSLQQRQCSIEIGPRMINQHNLIIPNYFGLQKQPETQPSIQGKKSKFNNRNSIFKNHQINTENPSISNEQIIENENINNKRLFQK